MKIVLTEIEEACVGSGSGVGGSSGELTGARTIGAQKVSDKVRSRGLSRRAHAGANPRARPHPKWIKEVAHSCRTDTVSSGKKTLEIYIMTAAVRY